MPKRKGARVTVLVEDRRLDGFVTKTLKAMGYGRHEIYVEPGYPKKGTGSGKQWVERKYPNQVRIFRAKTGHQKVALLVGTDADQMTVETRADQLATTLDRPRDNNELIAHWIPKWSIETWGLALTDTMAGEEISEDQSYKNTSQAGEIDWKKAATVFADAYRQHKNEPDDTNLPSLYAAYSETRRIDIE